MIVKCLGKKLSVMSRIEQYNFLSSFRPNKASKIPVPQMKLLSPSSHTKEVVISAGKASLIYSKWRLQLSMSQRFLCRSHFLSHLFSLFSLPFSLPHACTQYPYCPVGAPQLVWNTALSTHRSMEVLPVLPNPVSSAALEWLFSVLLSCTGFLTNSFP